MPKPLAISERADVLQHHHIPKLRRDPAHREQGLGPRVPGGTQEEEVAVAKFDKRVYEKESFGTVGIKESKDLPTLKLRYLMQLLARRKHKRAKLLEVGSGSGRILTSIRERDPYLDLTGIDISRERASSRRRSAKSVARTSRWCAGRASACRLRTTVSTMSSSWTSSSLVTTDNSSQGPPAYIKIITFEILMTR
jgi:hypothetical protein